MYLFLLNLALLMNVGSFVRTTSPLNFITIRQNSRPQIWAGVCSISVWLFLWLMKYCEYGSGVSATSGFAMGFRLDSALSNVYKDFRNRWRLETEARIFHRVMEWLRLEWPLAVTFSNALFRQGHLQHSSRCDSR